MTRKKRIEDALKHPIAWASGGVASIVAVVFALGGDPFGITAAIITVIVSRATSLFTGASIFGFTVAPNVDVIPAWPFQVGAIVLGIVVVAKILDRVWDSFKSRVLEE